jgi:thiol:disulfide interchange protein DsbD
MIPIGNRHAAFLDGIYKTTAWEQAGGKGINRMSFKLMSGKSKKIYFVVFLWALLFSGAAWGGTVEIDMLHSRDVYPAGDRYPVLFEVRIAESMYIHGPHEEGGMIPTRLRAGEKPGLRLEDVHFPPPSKLTFDYSPEPLDLYSGDVPVRAVVLVGEDAEPGRHVLDASLSYQACSSTACLPPERVHFEIAFEIVGAKAPSKKVNEAVFDSGEELSANAADQPWRPGSGFWFILAGVFFGGLALNLTPCIYPLIPITVSYFGGKGFGGRAATILHGALYILGLAVTNSILGVAASLSGGMLGSVLQNPFVLVAVALVLLILALSFFGFWELTLPSVLTRAASVNFAGFFGTFFMGLTLGIVAAPCLGPFILGMLTYVGRLGDPVLGFVYFFVLSIGMGLPLAVLAVFSSAIDRLPVSGPWMIWVRKLLGWVLVGMAFYMVQPLIHSSEARSLIAAVVVLAAGIHLTHAGRSVSRSGKFAIVRWMVGAASLAMAGFFIYNGFSPRDAVDWVPYREEVLEDAAARGKPVVIDFYADWCGPCRAMDRDVFADPEVVELSSRFSMVRVDFTRWRQSHEALQKRWRIRGVPTIVFLDGEGREATEARIESYISPDEMASRMKQF